VVLNVGFDSELPAALLSARLGAAVTARLQVLRLDSYLCLKPPALADVAQLRRLRLQLCGTAGTAGSSVGLWQQGLCRQLVELLLVQVPG
jgi:hypothetical protein